MPSEMEIAPRYTLFTLSTLFNTVDTVYTIQTALHLHCLNSSMYAYIYTYILLGKVRMLLEWVDGLLSRMLECMDKMGEWIDSVKDY